MRYKYTKHQVARGALPDAQDARRICIVKNVSVLRATYELRLLTFLASEAGKKLVIVVPKSSIPDKGLSRLITEFSKTIMLEQML